MKKLKLSLANMQGAEMLTREQLKRVIGGEDGSSSTVDCKCNGQPNGTVTCSSTLDCAQQCWDRC